MSNVVPIAPKNQLSIYTIASCIDIPKFMYRQLVFCIYTLGINRYTQSIYFIYTQSFLPMYRHSIKAIHLFLSQQS